MGGLAGGSGEGRRLQRDAYQKGKVTEQTGTSPTGRKAESLTACSGHSLRQRERLRYEQIVPVQKLVDHRGNRKQVKHNTR
ncbi:hypothetical protein RCEC007_730040 [Escherichia coli]|nr:hypothetical protein RCEC007_730040 [Escherichia coli]